VARYPALRVTGLDDELALAAADDYAPVAAQSSDGAFTIFFATRSARDAADGAMQAQFPHACSVAVDVDDEDWARRSQEGLPSITVGRITIRPARGDATADVSAQTAGAHGPIHLSILPSMGFGTGHHASTRLCLTALQRLPLHGRTVLDVGTGSGILALAARALGANRALGLDVDPDAVASAHDNLARHPGLDHVSYMVSDLTCEPLPKGDVVLANLTGALLCRVADLIMGAVADRGSLIVSGVLHTERDLLLQAYSPMNLTWEAREDEWVGFAFTRHV
jgi:ribosomal protein L11 methyltransferase